MDNYVAIRIGGNLITWSWTPFLEFVHTKMLSILNIIQDSDMLQVDKQTQEKKSSTSQISTVQITSEQKRSQIRGYRCFLLPFSTQKTASGKEALQRENNI